MRIFIPLGIAILCFSFAGVASLMSQRDFLAKHSCKLVHLEYGLLAKNVYQCDGNLTVKARIMKLD